MIQQLTNKEASEASFKNAPLIEANSNLQSDFESVITLQSLAHPELKAKSILQFDKTKSDPLAVAWGDYLRHEKGTVA